MLSRTSIMPFLFAGFISGLVIVVRPVNMLLLPFVFLLVFSAEKKSPLAHLKENLLASLQQASAAHAIVVMTKMFGEQAFSLQNLFAEERHRIMRLLSQETLTRLDQLYTQTYRENYGVIMAFHRDGLTVPQELQVAAEIALGYRCLIS